MEPWVEYSSPEDMLPQADHAPAPRRARRLITPDDGGAFFVYGEWDDGNGMYMLIGVEP